MVKNKIERCRYLLNTDVNEATDDELLEFNFDLIEAEVLNYCNRLDFPTGLMLIVIRIVADYTTANYYKNKIQDEKAKEGNGEVDRVVNSVSRGDTTISYGDNVRVTDYGSPMNLYAGLTDFVTDYKSQIRKYRRLRNLS